jgi:hypothetical protein
MAKDTIATVRAVKRSRCTQAQTNEPEAIFSVQLVPGGSKIPSIPEISNRNKTALSCNG